MKTNTIIAGLVGCALGFGAGALVPPPEPDAAPMMMERESAADPMNMDMPPAPVAAAPDTPVPSVRIVDTIEDMMGAYSVRVSLEDFTITPENIDQPPVPNEGHLHVYVDGEKVGREYSEWIYIPAHYFSGDGPHRITVSLNANTHAAWTFADVPIEDTVAVE
jgi:hypothetical protein